MSTRYLLLALLLWGVEPAQAQSDFSNLRDPAEPRVLWDHNVFGPPPEGPFRLEVYYKIFNDGLTYRKRDGIYVGAYELEIVVNEDGRQVAGTNFQEEYTVESFPRTLSQTDFLLNQLNVALERPGDYELVARLRDLKSGQASERRYPVKIAGKPGAWSLSSVEFARLVEPAKDTSQFNKRGWLVVPSVSRSYGGEAERTCPFYTEVYGPAESVGTPLRLRFEAYSETEERVLDTLFDFESQGRITPLVAGLAVGRLAPGEYLLKVELLSGKEHRSRHAAEETFHITWSLSTLLRTDYKTAVEQLKYIMTSDEERDSLLQTPDSLRAQVWEAFWKKRDPTPGTPMNEFRDEYYRRIRYANAAFTVSNVPGWRTDRGMVYISYGEPDEVERHPFEMEGQPYSAPWQVWYYYNPSRRFVFVDSRVTGDYRLQYPYDGDPWRY